MPRRPRRPEPPFPTARRALRPPSNTTARRRVRRRQAERWRRSSLTPGRLLRGSHPAPNQPRRRKPRPRCRKPDRFVHRPAATPPPAAATPDATPVPTAAPDEFAMAMATSYPHTGGPLRPVDPDDYSAVAKARRTADATQHAPSPDRCHPQRRGRQQHRTGHQRNGHPGRLRRAVTPARSQT